MKTSFGSGSRSYEITHNMGKAPMAFAYLKIDGTSAYIFCDIGPSSFSGVILSANSTTVTASVTIPGELTVVVLKDPIFIE